MAKSLSISEVKTRLPELVSKVAARDEQVVVTRKGKPTAVLLGYGAYEQLWETLDVLRDPAMMRQIHQSLAYFGKGAKRKSVVDSEGTS